MIITRDNHNTLTSRLCEVSEKIYADFHLMLMGDEMLVICNAFSLIFPQISSDKEYVACLTNIIANHQK